MSLVQAAVELKTISITTNDTEIQSLCAEQGICIQTLTEKSKELGVDVLKIVEKIKEQAPTEFTFGEEADINRFKQELEDQVNLCRAESLKIQLSKDRDAEVTEEDIKDGENGVGTWFADGFVNLFYWYWKSDEGRKEFIEDEIVKEGSAVPVLSKYLTKAEISEIAKKVSREHLISKDPIANTFFITKEAYKAFTQRIVANVLKENCVSPKDGVVDDIVNDFKACIDSSKAQRNIDLCQTKFEQSVGQRVGSKILDQLIEENFASQKPANWETDKWLAYLKEKAKGPYTKCSQSWFLAEKRSDPEDIQVCAYQGVAAAFSETINLQVDESLKKTVPEEKIRSRIVKESVKSYQCRLSEKLKTSRSWGNPEWNEMKSVTSDQFKEGLNQCVNNLTSLAGRKVSSHIMSDHPSVSEFFKDSAADKKKFVDDTIANAYGACIRDELKMASEYKSRLPEPSTACAPSPEELSLDPTLCEEGIVMEATTSLVKKGIVDNIQTSVADLYPENERKKQEEHLSKIIEPILNDCKLKANKIVANNLSEQFVSKMSKVTPKKKQWEKEYLQCSSGAIGLMAYELAPPTLYKELASNKSTAAYDVKLNSGDLEKFKKTISDCYSSKIAALEKVDQLSTNLDIISKECAFNGKKAVMPAVLPLVLEGNFKTYYKDPVKRQDMIQAIMNADSHDPKFSWRTIFLTAKNDKDIDEFTKRFQIDATTSVFGDLLIENLESFYPVTDEVNGDRNMKIQSDLVRKYVNEEFTNKMYEASDEEAEVLLNQAQYDVAKDIVSLVLSDNINDNISDPAVAKKLLKKFNHDFDKCLLKRKKSKDESSVVIEKCTEDIKIVAYNEIGFRVMSDKIKENIVNVNYADSTIKHLKGRLKSCLEKARGKKTAAFDGHLDGCLSDSALIISRDIGDFTILHYSSALNSKYSDEELEDYVNSVSMVHNGFGKKPLPMDQKDPAIVVHSVFQNCVNSLENDLLKRAGYDKKAQARVVRNEIETAMTKSDVKIGEVVNKLDSCAGDFEKSIVLNLEKRFLAHPYPGKFPDHKKDLKEAFSVMMLLRGEKDNKDGESSSPEETWAQLQMVGELTVQACNYDKRKCQYYIKQTKKNLTNYRLKNPNATDAELLDQFYNSSYLKFMVRSSISDTVRSELTTGVKDYMDADGLLEKSIDRITSSAIMEKALSGATGKKLTARVVEILKHGDVSKAGEDKKVRTLLAKALVYETPEFVDHLLNGLVEPQMKKERARPSFTTNLGLIFGIVKKDNLSWAKVRGTKYGVKARKYFTDEILYPLFKGEPISDEEMSKRGVKLEDKVVKAVKKAS